MHQLWCCGAVCLSLLLITPTLIRLLQTTRINSFWDKGGCLCYPPIPFFRTGWRQRVCWTSIAYDSWRTTMVNARQAADKEVMQGFLWGSIPSSALLVRISKVHESSVLLSASNAIHIVCHGWYDCMNAKSCRPPLRMEYLRSRQQQSDKPLSEALESSNWPLPQL